MSDRDPPVPEVVRIPLPADVSPGGETLEADFYWPLEPRAPVIVMGHGMAAERRFGLKPIAQAFNREGYAVLVPDYRGFGGSDGEPRYLVDARRHRQDLEAALDFAGTLAGVNPYRRILWGASFGGGHALTIAARRPDLTAVVAVVPHVDGLASALKYPVKHLPGALWRGVRDLLAGWRGAEPVRIPVVSRRGAAVLAAPDCYTGYTSILPPGLPEPEGEGWDARIPARIVLKILLDAPGLTAGRVGCPVLVQAAARDSLIPSISVRRTTARLKRARLEVYDMGHFGAYHDPWRSRLLERQLKFLDQVLRGEGDVPDTSIGDSLPRQPGQ